jgi:UPF0755 protein
MLRAFVALVVLVACLGAGAILWFQHALAPVDEGSGEADRVVFEVAPGDTLGRVAHSLEAQGLIRSARATRWLARAEDLSSRIKVGEYALSPAQSTSEILDILVAGRVQTHEVVIPEGLRATEIADRLQDARLADREAFLEIVRDPASAARYGVEGQTLEGYLFPDTYRFARGLPTERIIEAMVSEFLEVYRELEPEATQRGLSMSELVTLASIVEKETGVPDERPLIASVFLNRRVRGMRLETDPTVIYGIENFDGNLTRRHLEDSSNPYNTYRIPGLPPGPIANPGREAIEAVLRPAESNYLYFVSRNDGTHIFSKTYAEHARNVDRFQRSGRR